MNVIEAKRDQKVTEIAEKFGKFIDAVVELPSEMRRSVLEMQQILHPGCLGLPQQEATDNSEG